MSGFGSCGRLKQGRGCRNLTDTQCLLRASRKYLLVKNFLLENNNTHSNRPVPAGTREGTPNCPWIWTLDDNPNRLPRYLARAECHNFNFYCRAVFYSHSTLKKRCNHKSPVCTWWRIESLWPRQEIACVSQQLQCMSRKGNKKKNTRIDHFTVSCLVAWPLNESEAGGDLVLIETSLLFSC